MIIVGTPISDTKALVNAVYIDTSVIVNSAITELPTPEQQLGKAHQLYINRVTQELFYEYEDKPLSEIEQLLKQQIEEKDTKITELQQVVDTMLNGGTV